MIMCIAPYYHGIWKIQDISKICTEIWHYLMFVMRPNKWFIDSVLFIQLCLKRLCLEYLNFTTMVRRWKCKLKKVFCKTISTGSSASHAEMLELKAPCPSSSVNTAALLAVTTGYHWHVHNVLYFHAYETSSRLYLWYLN